MIGESVSHYRYRRRTRPERHGNRVQGGGTRLGRFVALKFLPPDLIGEADATPSCQRPILALRPGAKSAFNPR
jgi:hypothetical protein